MPYYEFVIKGDIVLEEFKSFSAIRKGHDRFSIFVKDEKKKEILEKILVKKKFSITSIE
ncbi:MAG: hypothetical protein N2999_02315 [Proteobacteria bacterium]|nr:hypothetical protein [Pseudomonadota bacterium]